MGEGFRPPVGPTVVGVLLAVLLVVSTGGGAGPVDAVVASAQAATGDALAAVGVSAPSDKPTASASDYNTSAIERAIHRRVNLRRAAADRATLAWDPAIRPIARFHSENMARNGYVSHASPDGNTTADRFAAFGHDCEAPGNRSTTVGENVLRVTFDGRDVAESRIADRVVGSWMNSSAHRGTLLATEWQREAIGVTIVRRDGQSLVYVTQNVC